MFESFLGIKIYIYDFDHNPPHFHAISAEYEVLIEIKSLKILRGDIVPIEKNYQMGKSKSTIPDARI